MTILSRPQCVAGTSREVTKSWGYFWPLQWRHNERDGAWNHQRLGCLINHLFRRWSNKTSKLHVTGLCEGYSPVTGEFPTQRASIAENVSIWWRHHAIAVPPSKFGRWLDCLPYWRWIGKVETLISRLWDFTRYDDKMCYCLMTQALYLHTHCWEVLVLVWNEQL